MQFSELYDKIMIMYLTIIGIAMAIISAVNILLKTASWYYTVIAVTFCTVLQFLLDLIIAVTIKLTPDRWYGINNPHFRVSAFEMEMYRRLRVRLWKDKVWELGGAGGFSKKQLLQPKDPAYIEKFIIECNKGVLTHVLSYPIGFLAILTLPNICAVTIALPVAIVNLFLNILPTIVLRYNTPLLHSVLTRLMRIKPKE